MGFTKLDESILQSSVMAAKPKTFKVWIALLAACDSDGIARVSPTFLARVCYLSMKEVEQAIEDLSSPDPQSRSLIKEGRRTERVDGGFFIVNYQQYRAKGISEAHKEKERERKKIERQQSVFDDDVRTFPDKSGDVTDSSASASASTSLKKEGELQERGNDEGLLNVVTKWNDFAKRYGLARVTFIKPGSTRYQKLRARLKEKEFDFDKILTEIENSNFLIGGSSNWRVTFDWIISPSNYPKILEGNYRDQKIFRLGENREDDDHPAGYWEKARELKEQGLIGESLFNEMKKIYPEYFKEKFKVNDSKKDHPEK